MTYKEKINELAQLIRSSLRVFALTGAGISTESGIPDFRSSGTGLWEKYDPIETASVSALKRNPAAFYDLNLQWWRDILEARPNNAHLALAELEKSGHLVGVITQNIDGLHQKAGSTKVWEIHGHLRTVHCMKCKKSYPIENLTEQYNNGINPPVCKCKGILRPDVVLFEDKMGKDFFTSVQILTGCDLLIVVGSSLEVYPAAALPERVKRVVIINRDPTPWDNRAALVLNDSAGKVLHDLVRALNN
ncbi:SIR2 family NAD-dependent protein deacylase [Desulfolucanica intricata]|uniref:SIR2 family NAD-dependent protein deacylase n=1 Tax=Desulfolucanica intricata TaxID=1285191 RepID=UPI000835673A|nr:NAD-dependent deacylase [Desulfolucanica intricata]